MRLTYDADGVSMPLRTDLKKKHEAIKALRDRGMTNVSRPLIDMTRKQQLTYVRRRSSARLIIVNDSTPPHHEARRSFK